MNTAEHSITTNWAAIWALFLAGCTLAIHAGKFPVALPLLVNEFNLTLVQTGNLVSIYALLIALCAVTAGFLVKRFGNVALAVVGISLCMIGSFAGIFASSVMELMLSRIVEGLGWLMGVIAMPAILSVLASPKDRPVVMGLWGAFMPIGISGMLFLAPTFQSWGGWRLSWTIASALSLVGVITVIVVCRNLAESLQPLRNVSSVTNLNDLRKRESIAAMLCFLCYSYQFMLMTAFLPTLLVQDSGMQLAYASFWLAVVVLVNAMGNVASGWLINAGVKRYHILSFASLFMGVFACIALSVPITSIRITAAILMMATGGLIPGTLFSTAALLASSVAGVGIIIGFMLTGAGIGQLVGPIVLTRIVELTGHWYAGGLASLFVGAVGIFFAHWLRRLPAEVG